MASTKPVDTTKASPVAAPVVTAKPQVAQAAKVDAPRPSGQGRCGQG